LVPKAPSDFGVIASLGCVHRVNFLFVRLPTRSPNITRTYNPSRKAKRPTITDQGVLQFGSST
jgi:hypothetical protein